MIELDAPTPEDLDVVLANLRGIDRIELEAGTDMPAEEVLLFSVRNAVNMWTIRQDGAPVILAGVNPVVSKVDVGIPWMVATPEIEDHPQAFAKRLVIIRDQMFLRYQTLANYAMVDNDIMVRFLEWLGFAFRGPFVTRGDRTFQLFVGEI